MRIKRSWQAAGAAAVAAAVLAGCGHTAAAPAPSVSVSVQQVSAAPLASSTEEQSATAAATDAFGLDLYHALTAQAGGQNLVVSPSGLSTLLAMLLPGAKGGTAQEMAAALHTQLAPEQYAVSTGALDRAARGQDPRLTVQQSDTVWVQQGYPVRQEYLRVLAEAFNAGVRSTDFAKDPEGARKAVNALVEQQTNGQIKDLFAPGSMDPSTLLALTDALYLKADWRTPFKHESTSPQPFHQLDGSATQVPTMEQHAGLRYAEGSGGITGQPWQAVELPYAGGNLAMDLLVPAQGGFDAFRKSLDAPQLDRILKELMEHQVDLALPKFNFETGNDLSATLQSLGMKSAFGPTADFSGIAGPNAPGRVQISKVVQKAKIIVDEQGTTAAAGSGAVVGTSAQVAGSSEVQLHIDRPFLFLIRDTQSGQPLFLGQVTDPHG
ncbi:serpin family protein [Kitasatospora azatica]|uniref:serpin family protein n=1 Tax=Kitasatospora azatica TaxID=58347 RepID=UPI0012F719E7|nr:serpin family protein [Kitasatospora azatica]